MVLRICCHIRQRLPSHEWSVAEHISELQIYDHGVPANIAKAIDNRGGLLPGGILWGWFGGRGRFCYCVTSDLRTHRYHPFVKLDTGYRANSVILNTTSVHFLPSVRFYFYYFYIVMNQKEINWEIFICNNICNTKRSEQRYSHCTYNITNY